jgi:predicted TIM-barrel enzyme
VSTQTLIERLHSTREAGSPVIVVGVGSGLTARAAARGGADLLAVYNTAIYRIRGLPTVLAFFPYDNANELTLSTAPEVMINAGGTPVLLGFGAHDPRCRLDRLVAQAEAMGACGVTNEPFLGMYGEEQRVQMEAAGLGFSRELTLVKYAVERHMLALGWVFSEAEAQQMAEAGVQLLGVVTGVTAGGPAGGVPTVSMDEMVSRFRVVMDAARAVRKDVMVLGHGGPLNDPESVAFFLERSGADGYATGSTGERVPVEIGVAEAVRRYKSINVNF